MQNDSDIISYAAWSLKNEPALPFRTKYHKPSSIASSLSSASEIVSNASFNQQTPDENSKNRKVNFNVQNRRNTATNRSASFSSFDLQSYNPKPKTFLSRIKFELRSFCCCLCFLTCRYFKFHSLHMFLFLLSLMGLFTQMIQGGYLSAIMPNLQTQYNMSTSKTGIITSSFDIIGVFAVPIVSYMGTRFNKAKVIGICGIIYAIGCGVFTLPYFLGPKYTITLYNSQNNKNTQVFSNSSAINTANSLHSRLLSSNDDDADTMFNVLDLCRVNATYTTRFTEPDTTMFAENENANYLYTYTRVFRDLTSGYSKNSILNTDTTNPTVTINTTQVIVTNTTSTITTEVVEATVQDGLKCNRDISSTWTYYGFIAGQLFMSIGFSPLFSLGITYITDNSEERVHAFYTGIMYGAQALGPVVGYLTASYFLSKWLYLTETPTITETDPRWVGCWFFGFLISACLMFTMSLLLLTFPETLSKHNLTRKEKRRLRKEKSLQSLAKNSLISGSSSGTNDSNKDTLNGNRRVLHTIHEGSESNIAELNTSYDYLDSISAKVSNNIANTPVSSTSYMGHLQNPNYLTVNNNNQISTLDSVSATISNTASSAPSSSINYSSGVGSEASSVAIIGSKPARRTFKQSAGQKITHSKLKIKGFISSVLKLLTNLRYTLIVIIMSVECVLIAGFTNYMVLYTQHVYQVSSSKSSILVGGVIVPSAILGSILGGVIVRKFNLYIEGCTRLIIASSTIVVAGIFVLLFIKCENVPSSGIDLATQSFNKSFVDCNRNCNCQSTYNPTCGIDKISYVSPCYAGCKRGDKDGYYECSCIPSENSNSSTVMAVRGSCSRNCETKLVIFFIVLFIVIAAESTCITPATILILKLIDKPLQPLALGVLRVANILIAFIPAPIVLSQVIDKTCILWNNQCVGDKGTCLEYNSFYFHYVLFGTSAGIKIFSSVLLIIFSLYIHKSYILKRKYRNRATLNHDVTSVLTPKQKYRIDSYVASSPTFDESKETVQNENKIKSRLRRRSSTSSNNSNYSGVVLKKHTIYPDDFTSLGRSQTPEFFNQNQIQNEQDRSTPGQNEISLSVLSRNDLRLDLDRIDGIKIEPKSGSDNKAFETHEEENSDKKNDVRFGLDDIESVNKNSTTIL